MKFSVPIGQRRQASAWKNRVLPVGDNDRNDLSCSDRDTASRPEWGSIKSPTLSQLSYRCLYYSKWSSQLIWHFVSYLFLLYFLFLTNLFNVLARTTPSFLRSHNVNKDSLAVDKTYDKSNRLHAMHYTIDLVVTSTKNAAWCSRMWCTANRKWVYE